MFSSFDSDITIFTRSAKNHLRKIATKSGLTVSQLLSKYVPDEQGDLIDKQKVRDLLIIGGYVELAPEVPTDKAVGCEAYITNQNIFSRDECDPGCRPYFSDEGLEYVRMLLRPRLRKLDDVTTIEEFEQWERNTPKPSEWGVHHERDIEFVSEFAELESLQEKKEEATFTMVNDLLYHYDSEGASDSNMSPWTVYDYIINCNRTDEAEEEEEEREEGEPNWNLYGPTLFKLYAPSHPLVLVGNKEVEITFKQLRGAIAVLEAEGKNHPFSMFGYKFEGIPKIYNFERDDILQQGREWIATNL